MISAAELAELIEADVERALATNDVAVRQRILRNAGRTIFEIAYEEANGPPESMGAEAAEFSTTLAAAINQTFPDDSEGQAERIAAVWAQAATNGAIVAAGVPVGASLTWVTMLDDKVRDIHRPLHGVTVAAGERFNVGGYNLRYPGEPVGPPEVWINCRCTLAYGASAIAADATAGETDLATVAADGRPPVVAAVVPEVVAMQTVTENPIDVTITAASDKPWSQFSASDYTIGQWRRACLLKMPGGDPESKSTYKLPVREPGGALNRNGVHAAASRIGQTDAPPEAIAAAKSKLRGLYRQLGDEVPDSLKAAVNDSSIVKPPADDALVAVNTHDAPGWLTHPRETQRLRRYWTRGPGAAKVGWGSPGDLTRCAKFIGKYVMPGYVWGTCQNLHYEALGYFNPESRGRHGGGEPDEIIDTIDAAFAAAAALEETMDTPTMLAPPLEWFTDPGFDAATPLTITSDGRVLGHLASWDTCHVGITDSCVKPPRSNTNYAHFRTGEVETREGELVAVGQITMDTGHAGQSDGPQAAVSHYDNTGTGVADVTAGEDEFGIWIAGAMRPGISEQQMYILRATGALSGDWRRIGGNLELVAALAVNVPGFPIPRVAMAAAASGQMLSLVAAAVVERDPNALDVDRIAIAVVDRLAERERRAVAHARVAALRTTLNSERVERLLAEVGTGS